MSSAEATVGRPRSKTLENLPPTSLAVDKIPRRPRSRSILPEVDAPKVLMVATPEETADEYVSPTVFDTTLRIGSHQSFAYFRKQDSSPKLQRYLLYSLSKFADSSHKVNALPTLSLGSKQTGLAKIASIIKNGSKKLSKEGLLHELYLNVHDQKSEVACSLVSQLTPSHVSKSQSALNRIFLLAMVNRIDSVCIALLEKGFPKDIGNSISRTSANSSIMPSYFILAVALDCKKLIEIMLELKPNLEASWNGVTPLLLAILRNDESLVTKLLELGASPDTPMSYENYHYLHSFKQAGPNDNLTKSPKRKPVDRKIFRDDKFRVLFPYEYAIAAFKFKIAAILLYHTKPSILSSSCYCFITCTDERTHLLLLKRKANTIQRDEFGFTPLHLAVGQNNLNLVVAFLKAGVDINARSKDGSTALHLAISVPDRDIVKYLVSKGADLTIKNSNGQTAIESAKILSAGDVALLFAPMNADTVHKIENEVAEVMANLEVLPSPLPRVEGEEPKKTATRKKSHSVDKKTGFLASLLGRKSTSKVKRSPSE